MRGQSLIFYRFVYYIILFSAIMMALNIVEDKVNAYQTFVEHNYYRAFSQHPLLYTISQVCDKGIEGKYYIKRGSNLQYKEGEVCVDSHCLELSCQMIVEKNKGWVNISKKGNEVVIS